MELQYNKKKMKHLKIKNTYDIKIEGRPSNDCFEIQNVEKVAVLPDIIPLIKPKLLLKEGDPVKLGQALFFDKQNPKITFNSPGGGILSKIIYGERRSLKRVEITLDKDEKCESFDIIDQTLNNTTKETLIDNLVKSGIWPVIRAFPFRKIADPNQTPPSIYVSIDNDEPFTPQSNVYLNGDYKTLDEFRFGIDVLKKLTDGKVNVVIDSLNKDVKKLLGDCITHDVSGNYPANEPGVALFYNKTSADENSAWYVKGHDVLLIARLLLTGKYPTERIVSVGGSNALVKRHVKTRMGASIESIIENQTETGPTRYISGGILTGRKASRECYIGFYENAINLIPEDTDPELLYFVRPGAEKASHSRSFLSALNSKNKLYTMGTNLNGGARSCISCGTCVKVCPVDSYPQLIMKSVYANDIEEMLELGLLDCVECGLCSYVCPSKIELDSAMIKARRKLAKEV